MSDLTEDFMGDKAAIDWKCRIGWHRFGQWSEPTIQLMYNYAYSRHFTAHRQTRTCLKCNELQERILR